MATAPSPSPDAPPTTAALFAAALQADAAAPTFDPHEIRLSEAGQCGRRQTLRALDYAPTPPSPRQRAIFRAGHAIEDWILGYWEAAYPGQVQRQIAVATPFGAGHIDGFVEPIRHLVECKSTTRKHRDGLPMSSHVDQVTLYLHVWGNARGATAEIAYYLKETGEIVSCPVTYDPDRAARLIQGLREVQAAITILGEPLPIPAGYQPLQFPCAWHTDAGLERCGFWAYCWGGRATPGADGDARTLDAPDLADDVARYQQVRQRYEAADRQLKALKAERALYEDTFRTLLDAHQATRLRAGDWIVRATPVAGRTVTDLDRLVADGLIDPDTLAAYQTQTPGYYRWAVLAARPARAARPKGDHRS